MQCTLWGKAAPHYTVNVNLPTALRDLYDLIEDFCDLANSEERRKAWSHSRTGRVLLEMVPICQQMLMAFHEEDFDRAVDLNRERQKLFSSWEGQDPLDGKGPGGQKWGRK